MGSSWHINTLLIILFYLGDKMAWKGRYKVKNPAKYKGDPTKVIYRSSLELKFMNFLDTHSDVLEWNSEEVVVPYRCVTDNKLHRYFVDFWFKKKTPDGKIESILVEIKPLAQTQVMTWGKNQSKWKAAEEYCKDRGWKFQIITEKELNS